MPEKPPTPVSPFVSIVTPVYNRVEFLHQCIESVLSQGIEDYEFILIDDCSTEDTRSVLTLYAEKHPQIRLHFCAKNGGPSVARNIGLSMANGQYLTLLDSDDRLAPGFLQKARALLGNTAADMLVFSIDTYDSSCHFVQHENHHFLLDEKIDKVALFATATVARLFRRDIIEEHHFRYPEGKLCEDALWSLMVNSACKTITAVPDVGYWNTLHRGSLSQNRYAYSKLSCEMLPLLEFDEIHGKFSTADEDGELFDYFCATFVMLSCFLWSRAGAAAGLRKVVCTLAPAQRRIRAKANRFLKYRAFRVSSLKNNVRPIQHFMTVSCIWLYRLHLIYPVALLHNLLFRLHHFVFSRTKKTGGMYDSIG